jgi:ABC-type dipeptide/oligopeptide/nickel transport system ATPase component
MNKRKNKDYKFKRTNKQSILFNTHELNAINKYCQQFKINNKSKFMREAIITEVLKKFDENYPTLFEDRQLTLFQ